ncbi:MAG TPA: 2OG-Fe(II) oxygenase [Candidatus Udaeobacter sp.]|nr:2OG-Fe(II) oxygenase [Candidatus Udaeobacter sp.]
MLDLERFRTTPLSREPFEFLVVPEFVRVEARAAIDKDYPEVGRAGSFPLREVTYGPGFAKLIEEMRSEDFRKAFEEKFNIDLTNRPDMITVRGRCSDKDGKIHTDSETKIITILVYMNSAWESPGGQLRLLRSGTNLEDVILEVPPTEGTLLAFRRSNNSWHGHKPFSGARRVIQFNWVTSQAVVRREQNRHRFSAWMKKLRGALSGEKQAA